MGSLGEPWVVQCLGAPAARSSRKRRATSPSHTSAIDCSRRFPSRYAGDRTNGHGYAQCH